MKYKYIAVFEFLLDLHHFLWCCFLHKYKCASTVLCMKRHLDGKEHLHIKKRLNCRVLLKLVGKCRCWIRSLHAFKPVPLLNLMPRCCLLHLHANYYGSNDLKSKAFFFNISNCMIKSVLLCISCGRGMADSLQGGGSVSRLKSKQP